MGDSTVTKRIQKGLQGELWQIKGTLRLIVLKCDSKLICACNQVYNGYIYVSPLVQNIDCLMVCNFSSKFFWKEIV
jgi:hypothetical protein